MGIFPGDDHRILLISPHNVHLVEAHFQVIGMRVITGSRYLGGLIRDQESEKTWLTENAEGWMHLVEVFERVACQHLQTDYSDLEKSF